MTKYYEFKANEVISSDENIFIVKCNYGACKEQCIAYLGDNDFFYSMETHKLLPATHWAFMPAELI